jgi:hypothetical protein
MPLAGPILPLHPTQSAGPFPPPPPPPLLPPSITELGADGNPASDSNVIPFKNNSAIIRDLNPGTTYKVGQEPLGSIPPSPQRAPLCGGSPAMPCL